MAWPKTIREAFDRRHREDLETGCWEWLGGRDSNGYGALYFRGRVRAAHRVAHELFIGPIPEGLHIDHLCRNPRCVNPEHLEGVTNRENVRRGLKGVLTTHCPHGHEYTAENTRITNGHRFCRACNRRAVAHYKRRKAAA